MSRATNQGQPLVVEWSRTCVRVFDPATRQSTPISNLAAPSVTGREIIVAISQQSAFIRTLSVPNASRSEIAKVISLQLDRLLPLNPKEYVFGFRLAAEAASGGRTAIVGAIKTDTLQSIYNEAKEAGVRIRAVLPLAFGSWLAAQARSLATCAVVSSNKDSLAIDILQNGELIYSRSIPRPDSPSEIADEIARTFTIAEVPPLTVLSLATTGFAADSEDDKESIEFLADSSAIDKQLFTFELPEKAEAERSRLQRWKAQRAIVAALAAMGLGAYAYIRQMPVKTKPSASAIALSASRKNALLNQEFAHNKVARTAKAKAILDVAFKPGQTFGDMVAVLANCASQQSWFTDIHLARGVPITISGLAMSDSDVGKFVDEIAKDPRFKEMKVVSTSKALIGKRPVSQFLVSGWPMGSLAFDKPPKAVKKT